MLAYKLCEQRFQPIDVADVARVVALALEGSRLARMTLDAVGPDVVSMREVLCDYRRWLGLGPSLEPRTNCVSATRAMSELK